MQDEFLFKDEIGRMENLTTDVQLVLVNPLLDYYSRDYIYHYEKVVEKDLGIVSPPLNERDFPRFDNLVPNLFNDPFIMKLNQIVYILIQPFDDRNVKVIQAPLIEKESLILHNPTLRSKSHAFEISSQPIYDDYYDDSVDESYWPNDEFEVLVLQGFSFIQNDLQPIYDDYLEPFIEDHANPNEEVNSFIKSHEVEIHYQVFEDVIWDSWVENFSISTKINFLHFHCSPCLSVNSIAHFSPSFMKLTLSMYIYD